MKIGYTKLILAALLVFAVESCNEPETAVQIKLTETTIPMPPDWESIFKDATSKTVSDTFHFADYGIIKVTAELLSKGADTSMIQKVVVMQTSKKNGAVFAASLQKPLNMSRDSIMKVDLPGIITMHKSSAIKTEGGSKFFIVHSTGIIEKAL